MNIIEVKNLRKSYGGFEALKGISFTLSKGEILGFLGPNGAGKTTTIQILLNIITPNSGEVKIFGLDAFHNREPVLQRMNFTSAYAHLFGSLTIWENLNIFARLYGIKSRPERITNLLREFNLEHLKRKKAVTLSSGELARAMVAKALLNDPELLLLDEPTSSLDPDMAAHLRDIFLEIRKKRGVSMLYTSHNMDEIEQICDRVIFLSHGQIVANDTPSKLTALVLDHRLSIRFSSNSVAVGDGLKSVAPRGSSKVENLSAWLDARALDYNLEDNEVHITTTNEAIPGILKEMNKADFPIVNISIEEPDLEDVFLKIAREFRPVSSRTPYQVRGRP